MIEPNPDSFDLNDVIQRLHSEAVAITSGYGIHLLLDGRAWMYWVRPGHFGFTWGEPPEGFAGVCLSETEAGEKVNLTCAAMAVAVERSPETGAKLSREFFTNHLDELMLDLVTGAFGELLDLEPEE